MQVDVEKKKRNPEDILFTNQALFALFLPLIAEQFFTYLMGLCDSVMVAHVGEAAVAGVSLVNGVMQLLIGFIAALTGGGAAVVGQYLGKRDIGQSQLAARQLIGLISVASILMMILVYLVEPLLWRILFEGITPMVRLQARLYFTVIASSLPFVALYSAGAALFRAMGQSKLPMRIMMGSNLLNVAANAILVYAFNLGTQGVAVATLVSRIVAAILILRLLTEKNRPIYFKENWGYRFEWPMLRRILRIGIPAGMENSFFYCGRIIVLSLTSAFGTASIAAGSVAGTIAVVTTMAGMAMNLGLTAVISRCVGAGNFEQAKYYHKKIMAVVYAVHFVVNVLVVAALPLVLDMYRLSETAAEITAEIVVAHAVMAVIIWPLAHMQPTTFRAAGDAQYPMAVGIISMLLCRIAMAYILGNCFDMGVIGVFMAIFMDWIVKAVLFTHRYLSCRWTRYRVIE